MKQFKTWVVCQFCGRSVSKDDAEGWLDQPHRDMIGLRVQRCPQHISEWALRHTREGRTKANRELARKGREEPAPPIPPSASPFPMREREE
jgi:hypothetical protein